MGFDSLSSHPVVVVTGGSSPAGLDLARLVADQGWPVVIVYLDRQAQTDAAVMAISAAGGMVVAVRADLADDLDVQRLFSESIAAFGDVDVVVHTTAENPQLLFEQAAQYVRRGGVIVITVVALSIPPHIESALRERGISVWRVQPKAVLSALER
jgi:NAD(P)-dependent dehydrogenase (short-subunit alcohol dehydrogenase family)